LTPRLGGSIFRFGVALAYSQIRVLLETLAVLDCVMPYKFVVNGKPFTVDVPEDMPLLWVLRDVLNLRGTKYGCGIGQCGACTVHFGGRAVRSCQTPIAAASDAHITTVEGLSPDGSHPVQVAWAELDVPQCGYCQAGQMMSAAALLAKISRPTNQDIDAAMNGNICRCGTYIRIRQAIHKAASLAASHAVGPAHAEHAAHNGNRRQS
jgi:isoquinoline 1-oxidoreductase alpha subunit